jgi:hypothetical protein
MLMVNLVSGGLTSPVLFAEHPTTTPRSDRSTRARRTRLFTDDWAESKMTELDCAGDMNTKILKNRSKQPFGVVLKWCFFLANLNNFS